MHSIECPNCKNKINLDQIDPGILQFDKQIFLYRFDKVLLSLYRIENLLENIRSFTFSTTNLIAGFFQVPVSQALGETPTPSPHLKPFSESQPRNLSSASSALEGSEDDSQSIDSDCLKEQKD